MTLDHLPSVEMLEQTHSFPGQFTFKAIGRSEDGFEARIVAAVREQLESDVDPPYRVRHTAGGRHVAVTLEPVVQNAWEVIAVYQRLGGLPGLVYLL